jgi:hypothetical protein
MRARDWAFPLLLSLPALLGAGLAEARLASKIGLSGSVADFDDRYVYVTAARERYRVPRSSVPDDVELKPGGPVQLEVSLKDLLVIPATAPATLPTHYKPPRKRTPARSD